MCWNIFLKKIEKVFVAQFFQKKKRVKLFSPPTFLQTERRLWKTKLLAAYEAKPAWKNVLKTPQKYEDLQKWWETGTFLFRNVLLLKNKLNKIDFSFFWQENLILVFGAILVHIHFWHPYNVANMKQISNSFDSSQIDRGILKWFFVWWPNKK